MNGRHSSIDMEAASDVVIVQTPGLVTLILMFDVSSARLSAVGVFTCL